MGKKATFVPADVMAVRPTRSISARGRARGADSASCDSQSLQSRLQSMQLENMLAQPEGKRLDFKRDLS